MSGGADAVAASGGERPAGRSLAEVRETVRSLIGMMSDGGIAELDLAIGDLSIRLRGDAKAAPATALPAPTAAEGPLVVAADSEVVALPPDGHVITAPMIGTYYASPSPGEPPFVRIGDPVEIGQVIGVIEAMKIMNEIAADEAGIVTDLYVTNAQAVEYGSPLMRLMAADAPA